jgi:uncharacterized protein (TIGR02147 family)
VAPDVFYYLDYRAFLRDLYAHKKAEGRGFSYRSFARRAKLGSPSFLKLVIEGQRNLSLEMAGRFASALGLVGDAADYFRVLVELNQAEDSATRDAAYDRLTAFRGYRNAQRLDAAHAEYHAHWYLPAIRELATRPDFEADPEWVADRMRPPISNAEAKKALDVLLELGLLVRREDGRVTQGEAVLTTGAETRGVHIFRYHRAMIGRASASLDEIPGAERDISAVTLCLGPAGIEKLKEKVRAFRREIIQLATQEKRPRDVVQVNVQIFPLSGEPAKPAVRAARTTSSTKPTSSAKPTSSSRAVSSAKPSSAKPSSAKPSSAKPSSAKPSSASSSKTTPTQTTTARAARAKASTPVAKAEE